MGDTIGNEKMSSDFTFITNEEGQSLVKRLEKEIDKLVYKLYDLAPEEIKTVEEFNRRR